MTLSVSGYYGCIAFPCRSLILSHYSEVTGTICREQENKEIEHFHVYTAHIIIMVLHSVALNYFWNFVAPFYPAQCPNSDRNLSDSLALLERCSISPSILYVPTNLSWCVSHNKRRY
jgi:hypothetical protein